MFIQLTQKVSTTIYTFNLSVELFLYFVHSPAKYDYCYKKKNSILIKFLEYTQFSFFELSYNDKYENNNF